MEGPVKEQPAPPVNSSNKPKVQRYALRSAGKPKEEKTPVADSSAPRRVRPPLTVSRSVGVLDLSTSGKDKSSKPPRRLSNPAKSAVTPARRTNGNITPTSEVRVKRSANKEKSQTPVSDVSRVSTRKKFNVLSSASYWLSQVNLSESAAKHSVSLGFFKLALEAGCEPLQRMRDELKAYASRHNLAEFEEAMKELFESYNVSESLEKLQVSVSCSQVPEDGTRSSDDDVRSVSSTADNRKLKPKSLNVDVARDSKMTESAKDSRQKSGPPPHTRGSLAQGLATPKSVINTGARKSQKNLQKPNKWHANKEEKIKQGKKSSVNEANASLSVEDATKGNKENAVDTTTEEISVTEVI